MTRSHWRNLWEAQESGFLHFGSVQEKPPAASLSFKAYNAEDSSSRKRPSRCNFGFNLVYNYNRTIEYRTCPTILVDNFDLQSWSTTSAGNYVLTPNPSSTTEARTWGGRVHELLVPEKQWHQAATPIIVVHFPHDFGAAPAPWIMNAWSNMI